MNANSSTPSSVIEILMAHRSVRAFTDESIAPGDIERLVAAGTRASTSSNMQLYSVISISDATLKKQVAAFCADQPQIHQSAAFLVFCADLHKLVLAGRMHNVDTASTGSSEALLLAVVDTALVVQNVAIAAESLGLGICMIGAVRNHPRKVAQALGLPEHVLALCGMCIGRPAEEGEAKPRLPLAATLHHNRYRSDDELAKLINDYDETQAKWYADRDLHPRDPRWSAVMSRRFATIEQRAEVGPFLRRQGFLTSDT